MNREDVPAAVAREIGRPVRWASPVFHYDGCERTLEIFNADVSEQVDLLRRLRSLRSELEQAAGGPIVFVFHTRSETARLYPDMV